MDAPDWVGGGGATVNFLRQRRDAGVRPYGSACVGLYVDNRSSLLKHFETSRPIGKFLENFTDRAEFFGPVSRARISPLEVSHRRLYFDTDSPPVDLFQNRFAPRRLYSKTVSGGRDYFIPRRNKLSPGGRLFSRGVGYYH